jgi:DNA-binding FrmR family transcriptional regulator
MIMVRMAHGVCCTKVVLQLPTVQGLVDLAMLQLLDRLLGFVDLHRVDLGKQKSVLISKG